ncbi:MAG TPA: CHAT domain-containing protein [Blastocatellia bacterium]|jgi:CHAT domain-containing protein/tetratricopeptide (TPR) repeat protein|nr:CHAT domain-containing protein [Blastocatellia bacterium]
MEISEPYDKSRLLSLMRDARQDMEDYERGKDLAALERALKLWEYVLRFASLGEMDEDTRLEVRNGASGAYIRRYWAKSDPEDLDQAVKYLQLNRDQASPDSAQMPNVLSNLGLALIARFDRTGSMDDLDAAINNYRGALDKIPPGAPVRASWLSALGNSLGDRYLHTGSADDLAESLLALHEAARITPPTSADLPLCLNNLGDGLTKLFLRTKNAEVLELAIQYCEKAAEMAPAGSTDLPGFLNNAGNARRLRHGLYGDRKDFDLALSFYRQAAEKVERGSPYEPMFTHNLGVALRDKYFLEGDPSDLNEAIALFRGAAERAAGHSLERLTYLSNLGSALDDRYSQTSSLDDLYLAIQVHEQAVDQVPPESPLRASHLNNLGNALRNRYTRHRRKEDIDRAVASYEDAVSRTESNSPYRASRLSNLGNALRDRFHLTEDLGELERAIEKYREALDHAGPGAPERAVILGNIGNAFKTRFFYKGDLKDLETAIESYQESTDLTPDDSPELPARLSNLGGTRIQLFKQTGDPADIEITIADLRRAVVSGLKHAPEAAMIAARIWAESAISRGDWEQAAEVGGYGMQALDAALRAQFSRAEKESWMYQVQGLPVLYAYAKAKLGDLRGAVTVLEEGRARLLSETFESDYTTLAPLRATHPDLYDQYMKKSDRLVQLRRLVRRGATSPPLDAAVELHDERVALDEMTAQIRRLEGFENFRKPPTFGDVEAALNSFGGGVAFLDLMTTQAGSLALIITLESIEPIWADVTEEELDGILFQTDGKQLTGGYLHMLTAGHTPEEVSDFLNDLLLSLGMRMLAPVAARLRESGVVQVIMALAGRLSLLPIHALQYEREGEVVSLLDEFNCSYTPNIRAQAFAQNRAGQAGGRTCLVGVGDPKSSEPPLEIARFELEQITPLFPRGCSHNLYGGEATKEALLDLLPKGNYWHLSCHGAFDPTSPLESYLQLSGEDKLALKDFINQQREADSAVRLAVLSACESAVSDFANLPDEVIGWPMALMQIGVPGIVGTIWKVDALPTALVMIKFYEFHLGKASEGGGCSGPGVGRMPPAQALREAVLWLRKSTNGEIAEYFLRQRDSGQMVGSASLWGAGFSLADLDERPFGDNPYHWAPFVFYGA